jgi:hypothetical protein
MVRLAAGVPNDALLQFTADLAARLKVTRVTGISAGQPVLIYGSPDMYVPPEISSCHRRGASPSSCKYPEWWRRPTLLRSSPPEFRDVPCVQKPYERDTVAAAVAMAMPKGRG